MLEIILTACLLSSPTECRDEHVPILEQVASPVFLCTKGGAQVVVSWTETHPKWKVVRWRCYQAPTKDV